MYDSISLATGIADRHTTQNYQTISLIIPNQMKGTACTVFFYIIISLTHLRSDLTGESRESDGTDDG